MEIIREKKLPETIVLEDEYRRYKATWMAALGKAQTAYETLLADRNIGNSLPEFEKLNSAWIKDFVSKKVDAVMASPNTYDARIEAADDWRALEKDLLKTLEPIEVLKRLDPEANVELKGCHITISNVDELLKQKTTFVVPQWYKDYYALAVEAFEAVQRLRDYQISERGDKSPFPISGILSFATRPEDFVKQTLSVENMKKFLEEQNKIPSHFQKQFDEHAEEVKRLEAERKKRFDEARAEKVRNGEVVDFGTSIRTVEGDLIPVR